MCIPLHLNKRPTMRFDKNSRRFCVASSLSNIKSFPLLHERSLELIGIDSRPYEVTRELCAVNEGFLFRINIQNEMRVWNLSTQTLRKVTYYH